MVRFPVGMIGEQISNKLNYNLFEADFGHFYKFFQTVNFNFKFMLGVKAWSEGGNIMTVGCICVFVFVFVFVFVKLWLFGLLV